MDIKLGKSELVSDSAITISGSKSETNRLLVLQKILGQVTLINASDSDDSRVMQSALQSAEKTIDIHHAGTAMRFLTAYFSVTPDREVVLTGSERMKQRPIGILVEALRTLGAEITYLEREGYPPLQIKGKCLKGGKVSLPANISSQYISALLLIAPSLEKGLQLFLRGNITSQPYLNMTLSVLKKLGTQVHANQNEIGVSAIESTQPMVFEVESDWSSASYFYSMVALAPIGTRVRLSHYMPHSLQGDAALVEIYQKLGVKTEFLPSSEVVLQKVSGAEDTVQLNLMDTPDIAQTIAVTCLGLGVKCKLEGLHTLKIKETDRLAALHCELGKFGAEVSVTQDSLRLEPINELKENVCIDTYQDHRMAMAFAPLALRIPMTIREAEVVSKSYVCFWEDLEKIGFVITRK